MPVDPGRVQAIFLAALEHDEPAERAGILDRECAVDAELRRRVEALLIAHDQPDSLLDRPFVTPAEQAFPSFAVPGNGTGDSLAEGSNADFTVDHHPMPRGGPVPGPTIGSPARRRSPRARGVESAPTSCSSRSARGAWAPSTWPSRRGPSAAGWPSRSSSPAWTRSR